MVDKEQLLKIKEKFVSVAQEKLGDNFVGIGIGRRIKSGKITDEECIILCVKQKKALSELKPDEVIPRSFSCEYGEANIDIVQTGEPFAL